MVFYFGEGQGLFLCWGTGRGLEITLRRHPTQAWKALAALGDYCTYVDHAGLGHWVSGNGLIFGQAGLQGLDLWEQFA